MFVYNQALNPGDCQARFVYTRPWEHASIREEDYTRANLRVSDDAADGRGSYYGKEVDDNQLPEGSQVRQKASTESSRDQHYAVMCERFDM